MVYTENDIQDILKQDRLGAGVANALFAVAGQKINKELSDTLDTYYNPAGKVTQRGSSEKKVKTIVADAMTGADQYLRPNGQAYFGRMWGEHSDVEVLKKARTVGHYVLLYGAPGCGKTALAEAALAKTSTQFLALATLRSLTSWVAMSKLRQADLSG